MTRLARTVFAVLASVGCGCAGAISFTDVSEDAGMTRSGETYGASWGELDGDGYPDLFVSMHRRMPSMFLNKRDGSFADVAAQTVPWWTKPNADTHGGTWFDFDNDGDQDLSVSVGRGNPGQFLVNEDGVLIDRTADLGMTDDASKAWGGRLSIFLDYDRDGRPDFVEAQMAGVAALMHQTEDGVYENRTSAERMLCRPFQYAQLLDVNGDGVLDLLCPDGDKYPERVWNTIPSPWQNLASRMIGGMPDGVPVPTVADSVIADFDNDGRMDIFLLGHVQTHPSGGEVSEDGLSAEARLMGNTKSFSFVSEGEVTFEIYQEGFGLGRVFIGPGNVVPTTNVVTLDASDEANDGMPVDDGTTPSLRIGRDGGRWTVVLRSKTDEGEQVWSEVYVIMHGTEEISDLKMKNLWTSDVPQPPTLLMGSDDGYVDRTEDAGLGDPIECVSAAAADFDNDMYPDLYLVCRQAARNIENILFRNRGDGTFERVDDAGGAGGPEGLAVTDGAGTGDSVATADYDLDGYIDMFVTNGLNLDPIGVGGPVKLYHNDGGDNNWLELDLVATESMREALGAKVEVSAGGVTQTRWKNGDYHRWSHDHTRMHFGLAEEDSVDITITWPSGAVETHEDVSANGVYRAVEGEEDLEAVTTDGASLYVCGLPAKEPIVERGIFVSRNCAIGSWSVRFSSGGSDTRHDLSGTVTSSDDFESVTPRGVEQDVDEVEADGDTIGFSLKARGSDWDGFDFVTGNDDSSLCVEVTASPDVPVYIGATAVEAELEDGAFDPMTGRPCGAGDDDDGDDDGDVDDGDDGDGDVDDGDDGGDGDVDDGDDNGDGDVDDDGGDDDGVDDGDDDDGAGDGDSQSGGGGSGALGPLALLALAPLAVRRWRQARGRAA